MTKQRAFTIVELLIVIVVIAILAAISIVAYTGIQNSANDAAVQSDLRNLRTKIEMFRATNDLYPTGGSAGSHLSDLGFVASKTAYATSPTTENNIWYCRDSTRLQYGVVALSKSGKVFYISQTNAPTEYTGSTGWHATNHNCGLVRSGLGWQYAGYVSSDTTTGPWRAWAGGN